jgi:hypothetical protein
MVARVMGPETKKRSSQKWDERFVRGATQFRHPFNQKTRWCATGKKASLTHYSGTADKSAYTFHPDNGGASV